jgi:hypothetical protein
LGIQEIKVGDWVRVKQDAFLPVPKVVKNNPQRVRSIEGDKLTLERWMIRFRAWIKLEDIPLTEVELIPEEKAPFNSCLVLEFNKRNSGVESYERGRCSYCSLKNLCDYWQRNHV